MKYQIWVAENSEGDKVIGTTVDIAEVFKCSRHTVYAATKGKLKLRGEFVLRLATEQEGGEIMRKKIIGQGQKISEAQMRVWQRRKTYEMEMQHYEEQKKPHVPKPYRSSSARRFTPL